MGTRLHEFPTRDGVGASVISLPVGPWPLIIDFLAERFATVPREEILARMTRGDVFDEGGGSLARDAPYRAQQKLYYYRHVDGEPRIPFEERVLYQDEFIVVADKPHFLPPTPGGRYVQETLLVRLKRRLGIDNLAPMHRLDRETAGLMLFSIQPETRARYARMFAIHGVEKHYEAIAALPLLGSAGDKLVFPHVRRSRIVGAEHFMCMHEIVGEANAETRVELLESGNGLGHFRLTPLTGKKHQLRVHMAALGMPILNDKIYPTLLSKADLIDDDFSAPLQLLAKEIAFTDPVTGEHRTFETEQSLGALSTITST